MEVKAIVYSSNTGFTARYAKLLAEQTGLPAYDLKVAGHLPKGAPVIYMGWLMAGTVKDYRKAATRYSVKAVCGVALGTTGSQVEQVRKSCALPEEIPAFTLQGGMDHSRLKGVYKAMIRTLIKVLSAKKNKSGDEEEMLRLLETGGDFVRKENLAQVLTWYRG